MPPKTLIVAAAAIVAGLLLPQARAENPLLLGRAVAFGDEKISPVQAIEKQAEPIQKFSPAQSPAQISAVQKSVVQKAVVLNARPLNFLERRRARAQARAQGRARARSSLAIGCASGLCS